MKDRTVYGTPTQKRYGNFVAQWLGHRIADCKVSGSSPAVPTAKGER